MLAIVALFIAVTISMLFTKVATIALTLTGLTKELSRFQSRSAITGVGFTTSESERMMNHPIRRRILMILMLLGNLGIVTVLSTTVIAFVDTESFTGSMTRFGVMAGGLTVILTVAYSSKVDKYLERVIGILLKRWTHIVKRDYVALLRIGGEYQISELLVTEQDWLAGERLSKLGLRDEGIIVLGIQKPGGEYIGAPAPSYKIEEEDVILVYATATALDEIDKRGKGVAGELEHIDAVVEEAHRLAELEEKEFNTETNPDKDENAT